MNIRDFPAEVADEVESSINVLFAEGSISIENLTCLNNWVTDEGYGTLTDAYDDWIVADLNRIAEYNFSDDEMMNDIDGPELDGTTPINDSVRVDFARKFLVSDRLEIDDSYYPSPVSIEISVNSKNVTLGVLLHPGGQGGVQPELIGLFKSRADFSNTLLSKLYVQIIPSESGDMISDETILDLWHK